MHFNIARVIFAFFCLAFLGWFAESAQESIVRKKLISKGFFYGPFVPVHGFGGLTIYFTLSPIRAWPVAVFIGGLALGTIVEYITALFLEKCFKVKCWDYRTYPHTRRCHFQGRVSLTISLFFGVISLVIVYTLWDFIMAAAAHLGGALFIVDAALIALFVCDALVSCMRVIKAVKSGGQLSGWAVFTPPP
ncbi:MAG: putative ABC transporter permease, partial [Treponema sp.]|nr:putative ABC transporter permease [Treponema sp.]